MGSIPAGTASSEGSKKRQLELELKLVAGGERRAAGRSRGTGVRSENGSGGRTGQEAHPPYGPNLSTLWDPRAPRRSLQVAGRNRAERSAGAWVLPVSVTETFYGLNG
jgi:hypothetical protein